MKTISIVAGLAGVMFAGSAAANPIYSPVGPQTNVSIATVTAGGWNGNVIGAVWAVGPAVSSAVSGCTGSLMMLAGGVAGSDILSVLAWRPRWM